MYSHIAANKRKTAFLIALVCAILVGLVYLLAVRFGADALSAIVIGTLVATCFSLFSYYMSDSVALTTSRAREIQKSDAPELWNLVENLAIANGLPMPKVYVMEDAALNAFATGRDPAHASIAFTTGILGALTKQELEGVAAHELSHIKNYDIRVMTTVVVLIGGIMLVADLLLRSTLLGRRNDHRGNAGMVLFVLGLVLAILSPLLAELIKLAISRNREYLADAGGALLTRYPEGLAAALEKLGSAQPMQKANHATAHLFIVSPFARNLFSTHPPLAERIARLRSMGR